MAITVGKRIVIIFALALVLVIANAIISYQSVNTLIVNNGWVLHTYEVLAVLDNIFSTIKDAEVSQRGFLITGDENYLQTFNDTSPHIYANVQHLQELTSDNPNQQRRIPGLKQKIADRFETLNSNVELRKTKGLDFIRQSGLLAKGTNQMAEINQAISEMVAEENYLLQRRTHEAEVSGRNTILTFLVANFLVLALFVLVYYLISRDIAERKRSEAALQNANDLLETKVQERTAELGKTNTELERSNRELQDFAFVASHDLQEPLRKIQAFGDRLRIKYADRLGEEGHDHLGRMQNAARRMQTLINDLLTFSRVTTKAQPFIPVNLEATAKEVLNDLETRIQQTQGRVEISSLPTIEADPLQMRQLLQNLIGNALKFHRPEVPPIVKVAGEFFDNNETDEQNSSTKEFCRISIEDNGIGFDEKYLDRIFTPFQRLHARHEYEGTGMGLAVCRKIIERHNGTITAKSIPDSGTTFIFTLPVKQNQGE